MCIYWKSNPDRTYYVNAASSVLVQLVLNIDFGNVIFGQWQIKFNFDWKARPLMSVLLWIFLDGQKKKKKSNLRAKQQDMWHDLLSSLSYF